MPTRGSRHNHIQHLQKTTLLAPMAAACPDLTKRYTCGRHTSTCANSTVFHTNLALQASIENPPPKASCNYHTQSLANTTGCGHPRPVADGSEHGCASSREQRSALRLPKLNGKPEQLGVSEKWVDVLCCQKWTGRLICTAITLSHRPLSPGFV